MINAEVSDLLRDAQQFWFQWRDNPPRMTDTGAWEALNGKALDIAKKHGNTERVIALMSFFKEELHLRSQEAEHGTK